MIKRETTVGEKVVVTYICDNCVKEMPGAPILCYFPFGHINDSLDGPSHFCSDKCVIDFENKMIKKYGPWKSEAIKPGKKVRSSGAWRTATGVSRPKARRVVRRVRRKTKRGTK